MKLFGKNPEKEIILIAEIGVNHEGNIESALNLIELAALSGADAVKFQSYTPEFYTSRDNLERFERIKKFALSHDDHLLLIEKAQSVGIEFFSTPLSEDWISFLNNHVNVFKIASGDITFETVIKKASETGKKLIISTGGSSIDEIDQAVSWVEDVIGREYIQEKLVLMHCISSYPAPLEQANINSIPFLSKRYGINVGFSNHVIAPEACYAALALGTNVFELHFTDKKDGRTFHDHKLSFEPNDIKKFLHQAKKIKASLGDYNKTVQACEIDAIPNIRKGLVASRNLSKGHVISDEDIHYARPASGFTAAEKPFLIGKTVLQDIKTGHHLKKDSVG
jgi:N-acetylneuraminate synthase/N,N'-diacetyllegionaminate synthase